MLPGICFFRKWKHPQAVRLYNLKSRTHQSKTTMLIEFSPLTPEEQELMFEAIPLITVLVAGADGNIDERERHWSKKLANIRSWDRNNRLKAYYEQVDQHLARRVAELEQSLPSDIGAREAEISRRLEPLNDILSKMEQPFPYLYYRSFCTYAKSIAEASGGFIRYFTVGPEQDRVIDLPMLKPIHRPDNEEWHGL